MADRKPAIIVTTPRFRVSFPHIFKPRHNELSGKDEFSLQALFKLGEDLTTLMEAAKQAQVNLWGADQAKWPKGRKNPFKKQEDSVKELDDGTTKILDGYISGAIYITLKSYEMPPVVDQTGKNRIFTDAEFYAGCWARAKVSVFAYEKGGGRGVSFWLNNLQKVADDAPFSGRPKPEEVFSAIEENAGTTSTDSFF